VLFATIFWFLNALSKDYTITVNYPVHYVDFPKDKVLIKDLPDQLSMEVKGYGFALMRYKISTAFSPITFNINSYTDNKLINNNVLNHSIVTNKIRSKISKKISKDIHIIKISPDTINLHFSKIIKKKVAIKPVVNAKYANQYAQNGSIKVSPDSVVIYAASVIADTTFFIETSELTFKNLNKSIKRNVTLKEIEGIEYETKRTVVNIPVDQFIESSKEIEIEINNCPENIILRLFPDKIKIAYRVGLSNFKKIQKEDFKLSVDYNELTNISNILKVNLEKFPELITNVEITTSKVECIIEKK
jgi:YbbR domain-containing protein